MNRVSHFVNNFFHYIVATAGLNFQAGCALQTPAHRQPLLPSSALRFRYRERGVILSTRPQLRKPLCEKSLKKPPCADAHGGLGLDGLRFAMRAIIH
ncbi:hypothetical protein BLA6860_05534 [Burkholderia lata]|nr:hypothetical protein BLA6860_05534 [Burkholderia lata]